MKFIDQTTITICSGAGGPGLVSFKSARNVPKMGADGGDGGHGGSVYFRASSRLSTLSGFDYKRTYRAEDGVRGGTNGKTGRCGEDLILDVPPGTVVLDAESREPVGELLEDGDTLLVARGGKRGLGNIRYLTSRHQAPEECTEGGPSTERTLTLELKLLADVGIAGFPNAGKSTLLSTLSQARPKIADYPFTTLTPQLGVVSLEGIADDFGASFVMADIPGLIEGASDGLGLGHKFLKHLSRTKVILYLLDGMSELSLEDQLKTLKHELGAFDSDFTRKPFLIAVSKADAGASIDGFQALLISSVSGQGLRELVREIYTLLEESKVAVDLDPVSLAQPISGASWYDIPMPSGDHPQ